MASDATSTSAPEQTASPRQRRWLEAGLILAFWTLIAVLMVGSRLLDARRPGPEPRLLHYLFLRSYLWALMTPLIFWVGHRFTIERPNWPLRVLLHLGIALVVGAFADMLSDALMFYYVRPPWAEGESFEFLEDFFELDFLYEFAIYLAVLTAGFARDYFLRYQERLAEAAQLRAQTAELQAQLAEARLQALRMQVNPHFLFNTLHAISTLVERDPTGVRRMIARLSELLRYTLESGPQEVPLERELEFLDGYLEIQRIRFQGRLEVKMHVEPETLEALVPNLILQPLVENAIKHGASQIERIGRIEIGVQRDGDRLQLSVQDNGPGLSAPPDDDGALQGFGLRNTQERLENLYGEKQSLDLVPAEDGGLDARITIPFHTQSDLQTAELPEHEVYAS